MGLGEQGSEGEQLALPLLGELARFGNQLIVNDTSIVSLKLLSDLYDKVNETLIQVALPTLLNPKP